MAYRLGAGYLEITSKILPIFALVAIITGFLMVPFLPTVWAIPAGFTDTRVVGGLNSPTAMDFSPDSRLFVDEKDGNMRIVKNGMLLATPFLSVPVDSAGERGLLGIAFDPNFATNGYVYAYYTATTPTIHNRVSRFTADPANPDKVLAGSEFQILNLETLSTATNHNGGAIHFGKDGKLYVAVGENANSANSQSLSTRLGKILRINSDGSIPSDNPFFNTTGAKQEIWAWGLRNPFTFAFSPAANSSLMYINDVGQDTWEEINSGVKGANYGWPTCEGICSNPSFVDPIYTYNHNGAGAAITGAAFYESTQFPSEYKDSYFFGDYVSGFIKRLTPSNQVVDFLSGLNSPVDLKVGPDGSLFYLSIGSGEVHKVEYSSGGNNAPSAVASGSPTSGAAPLTVNFTGSGSSDPDSDPLTYSWDFGDSSTATGINVSHTYASAGPYTATLTVSDGRGGINMAYVNVSAGTPPAGTIDTPAAGVKYNAGDTISFSGTATDAEDGSLPADAFKWVILLHHNTHTHPFEEFDGVKSGSFTIPTVGETDDDVWYRIYMTVTDSSGLSTTTTRDVTPNKSTITLSSNPQGLQVNLDGQPKTTPYTFVGVVGMSRTVQAVPLQDLSGQTYRVQSWSDGGSATHMISTPPLNMTYIANYTTVLPSQRYNIAVKSADMMNNPLTGYQTTIDSGGSTVETGFTPMTYAGNAGATYAVTAYDYGNAVFDHWDDGSTGRTRTVSLNADMTMTAYYKTPPSTQATWRLTVVSQDSAGNTISGYRTTLYDSAGNVIAGDFTPATFTLNAGQQYSIGMGDFGASMFNHWDDNDSTANPRGVSITADTQLAAVYESGQIVHMDNRVTSWGSLLYPGRQINAEYAGQGSQLIGDNIDSITVQLMKWGSPTGTMQVGIFNEDLTVKKLFATVNVSTIATSYQDYEFKLANNELYTIQAGDRIGVKYSGGDSNNGIFVMIDRDTSSSFDGVSSQRVRYETGWLYYDTGEDMYMVLKQTHS